MPKATNRIERRIDSANLVRLVLLFSVLLLEACISGKSDSGVVNTWRSESLPAFEKGTTTQAEVAHALGPPSQLIDLGDQVIFYYLRKHERTKGFILIVYNESNRRVSYDRAIFFFDKSGVLEDYALSLEELEYDPQLESGDSSATE